MRVSCNGTTRQLTSMSLAASGDELSVCVQRYDARGVATSVEAGVLTRSRPGTMVEASPDASPAPSPGGVAVEECHE
jgi:hypothetical protein